MKAGWPQHSLGIYVHIPFCRKKCSYCDFYSVTGLGHAELEAYTNRLCNEIAACPAAYRTKPVDSVFFGGGTPSLLTPTQINRMIQTLASSFHLQQDAEITMEANPATVDLNSLVGYRQAGINRISLGVQSLQDSELQTLGRLHSANTAAEAITAARAAGFDNLSLDLIYGIPGQTKHSWMETLTAVAGYLPRHISIYLLQLDDEVPMAQAIARGELAQTEEEECEAMYFTALDYMGHRGLKQYEISNLAEPGYSCRHNLRYWHFGEYLGFGAAAVSRLGNRRWMNRPDLDEYMSGDCGNVPGQLLLEKMDPREQAVEAVIMALRLHEGVNLADYKRRFGIDLMQMYKSEIEMFISQGKLELEHGWLRLTKAGIMVSNQVLCGFVA